MQQAEQFLKRLQQGAASLGWNWESAHSDGAVDGWLHVRGRDYAVVLGQAPVARRQQLQALLADACLRAQRAAKQRPSCEPLPVVAAPRLTPAMLHHLAEYAKEFLPIPHWGAFDLKETWRFHGLHDDARAPASHAFLHPSPWPKEQSGPLHDPFSDLGQWLSKVALAPRLSPHLLRAPLGPFRSLSALAHAAEVSVSTASRWAAALRETGFLADSGACKLVRIPEFLERWAAAVRGRSYQDLPVRPILGSAGEELVARLAKSSPSGCLVGATACDWHGVGVVRGAREELAIDDFDPARLEALGLRRASSGEPPALVLRRPKFEQSFWRGVVERDGMRAADVIQCCVDALNDPVRGRQQAEAILRHLGWSDR